MTTLKRNLIMVTGRSDANQQDALANNLDVGVVFDPTNKYTGIAGTLVAMAFNYIAGENVYEGSFDFHAGGLYRGELIWRLLLYQAMRCFSMA